MLPSNRPRIQRSSLLRPAALVALIAAATLGGGCVYNEISRQCPSCQIVGRHRQPVAIPPNTRTLYLLVPGILGFGWEWDKPVVTLKAVPEAATQVFDWRPSSSLLRVAAELTAVADDLWSRAPASMERLVIVGHSAGGLVTAHASSSMRVPAGKQTLIVNVGAPYAGMGVSGDDGAEDLLWSPFISVVGFTFRRYPVPAAGVQIESWVTSPATDPVMKIRFGHHPEDPRIGPPGPRVQLADDADHNAYLANVIANVIARQSPNRVSSKAPGKTSKAVE